MTRYHIHPTTGTPAACRATQGRCPFGASQDHYESKEAARSAFETQMHSEILKKPEFEPVIAEYVKDLFGYHIEKTDDVDVKALLRHTQDELATSASLIKLSRTVALYTAAAADLDDDTDENLSEASLTVAEVADHLKEHYRVMSYTYPSPEEKEAMLQALRMKLSMMKRRNLNRAVLQAGEGEVVTGGHNAVIVSDPNSVTAGEVLRSVFAESVYYGEAREAQLDKARMEVEARGTELIKAFSPNGVFLPPRAHRGIGVELPEGFKFLDSGAEANVYLHEASDTVYKLPHDASYTVEDELADASDSPYKRRYALNSVVFKAASAYEKVNRQWLNDEIDAEYLPTHFMTLEDEAETPVGMIVQPYLDESRYMKYYPAGPELFFDEETAGVADVHTGNLRLDRKTGKLVLFDCLFELD
jgi:hypothetical protein